MEEQGPDGKFTPEFLEWARSLYSEEDFIAGMREIEEAGGLELGDFLGELEEAAGLRK